MKRSLFAGALAALALMALAAPASAIPIHLTGSGNDQFGSHQTFSYDLNLDGTLLGSNYVVGSISGTQLFDGVNYAVSALSTYAGADQLLNAATLLPDFSGVSYTGVAASLANVDFNLFTNGGLYQLASLNDAVGYSQSGSLVTTSTSEVPEPLTLSLFGAGLAGLAFAMRRRRKGEQGDLSFSSAAAI